MVTIEIKRNSGLPFGGARLSLKIVLMLPVVRPDFEMGRELENLLVE